MNTASSRTSSSSPAASQDSAPFKIRGTKVTSPYPVQLTPAETRLVFSLQRLFPPEHILVDNYFPATASVLQYIPDAEQNPHTLSGELPTATEFVQIDCIAINEQGIFIFESKDYAGWIFGNGHDRYWTQVLNYGREKHRFYSPILQNSAHLRALPEFPPGTPIHSIIVFGRDAVLRNISNISEPHHVCTQTQLRSLLPTITPPHLLSSDHVTELYNLLRQSRVHPSAVTRQQHISDLSQHFSS